MTATTISRTPRIDGRERPACAGCRSSPRKGRARSRPRGTILADRPPATIIEARCHCRGPHRRCSRPAARPGGRSACCARSARAWSSARAWRRSCSLPLFVGVVVLLRPPRQPARRTPGAHGHAADELEPALETPVTRRDRDRAGDPRLGDRARHRARPRAAAVPAPGPGDGGHGRLPDPPGDDRRWRCSWRCAWRASKRARWPSAARSRP